MKQEIQERSLMNYSKPRGTTDNYGEKLAKFDGLRDVLLLIGSLYNYNRIQTPTFEHLEVFTKAVGDTSDIVNKELYVFKDKSDRVLALRPEGTAGAIRAYVENKMWANTNGPVKLCYFENLFRYERPQAGRMREFHQFGVELIGAKSYLDDVEVIAFANNILNSLHLDNYTLEINNIGGLASRKKWIEELQVYFEPYKDQLSEISQARLAKNPLRILDDKVDGQLDFVKNAPKLSKYLSDEENLYFKNILTALDLMHIPYQVNENLVRGLDYYTGVVFEFVSHSKALIGQSTIIGGGRYGELVKQTGGPDLEGIGFGLGVERILVALDDAGIDLSNSKCLDVYIGATNNSGYLYGLELALWLRNMGYKVDLNYELVKKDKCARQAIRSQAKAFIWIEPDNVINKTVSIELLKSNQRAVIPFAELKTWLEK